MKLPWEGGREELALTQLLRDCPSRDLTQGLELWSRTKALLQGMETLGTGCSQAHESLRLVLGAPGLGSFPIASGLMGWLWAQIWPDLIGP